MCDKTVPEAGQVKPRHTGVKKVHLQSRGVAHFSQLILSLSLRFQMFVLAFEVELVEFACDDRQRFPLGLGQKQADVERAQQADRSERHEAVLAQLAL